MRGGESLCILVCVRVYIVSNVFTTHYYMVSTRFVFRDNRFELFLCVSNASFSISYCYRGYSGGLWLMVRDLRDCVVDCVVVFWCLTFVSFLSAIVSAV